MIFLFIPFIVDDSRVEEAELFSIIGGTPPPPPLNVHLNLSSYQQHLLLVHFHFHLNLSSYQQHLLSSTFTWIFLLTSNTSSSPTFTFIWSFLLTRDTYSASTFTFILIFLLPKDTPSSSTCPFVFLPGTCPHRPLSLSSEFFMNSPIQISNFTLIIFFFFSFHVLFTLSIVGGRV